MTKLSICIFFVVASISFAFSELKADQSCCNSCGFYPPAAPPSCAPGYNPLAYSTCPGNTCDACGIVSGRFDFLWWRAYEEGTSLGTEETINTFTTRTQPYIREKIFNNSRIKNLNSHYKPGFRLGLDYICLCDGWDAAINWTHFHANANTTGYSKFNDGKMVFLLPFWERIHCLLPQKAKATWKLELDLVDLELGRKFYVSSCIAIRPLIGIRVARIMQSYRTDSYANDSGRGAGLADVYFSRTYSTGRFSALGPRIGASMEYQMGCGVALFGEAATSILFGRFNRHANEQCAIYEGRTPTGVNYDYHSSTGCDRQSRTITDMSIGINYSRCIEWCNKIRRMTFSFAWEHHAFYNLNSFNFAPNAVTLPGNETGCSRGKKGNLYTQGLVFSADVTF